MVVSMNGRASAEEMGVRAGAEPATFKQSVATVTLDPKTCLSPKSLLTALLYMFF